MTRGSQHTQISDRVSHDKLRVLYTTFTLYFICIICSYGCSGYDSVRPNAHDLPSWTLTPPKGCAVGSLPSQGSRYLTRIGATARARAELSRQLQTQIESVIKTYFEERSDSTKSRELLLSRSVQSTQGALEGTQVSELFEEVNSSRTLYALVCIERARALKAFEVLNEAPEPHREALRARARSAFEELERRLGSSW